MAKLPGSVAVHAVITDECRTNNGFEGTFEETVRRLRLKYHEIDEGWPIGKGVKIHVAMIVERPKTGDLPLVSMPATPMSKEYFESLLDRFSSCAGEHEWWFEYGSQFTTEDDHAIDFAYMLWESLMAQSPKEQTDG